MKKLLPRQLGVHLHPGKPTTDFHEILHIVAPRLRRLELAASAFGCPSDAVLPSDESDRQRLKKEVHRSRTGILRIAVDLWAQETGSRDSRRKPTVPVHGGVPPIKNKHL